MRICTHILLSLKETTSIKRNFLYGIDNLERIRMIQLIFRIHICKLQCYRNPILPHGLIRQEHIFHMQDLPQRCILNSHRAWYKEIGVRCLLAASLMK